MKRLKGKDDSIRKKLLFDINNDLARVEGLGFMFERLIFASTFRDDTHIQEFLSAMKIERAYSFNIYYWGWDTITRSIEQHDGVIKKYFPQFRRSKKPKSTLPDGALGTDLLRKNYVYHLAKRYGDWKQEVLKRRSERFTWPGHPRKS